MSATQPLYWDTYHQDIWKNPYPTYRRLREEAPLYYNEEHGFYALSRYQDVHHGLLDRETFSSARGGILEIIKANAEFPQSMFIFQDPPIHTSFRGIMQRIITPKRMNALEQKVRDFCARSLDPLIGADGFDFIANLGAQMPMRVIGMLLGVPEEDQEAMRNRANAAMRAEPGKAVVYNPDNMTGVAFEEYIDWRSKHPGDDITTELINTEFKDPQGVSRKLTRDELLAMINMLAGAGNETTTRLIGWTGKVLGEHPDQRRELAENPALIQRAIEELVRFEPPGQASARWVTRDVEYYGQKVPAGSIMMMIMASGNRDDRQFVDGDKFNIRREARPHVGFGHGIHVCIGAPLARLEGRIALEEVLKRFKDWEVDYDNAELSPTTTVRGWDSMPVFTTDKRPVRTRKVAEEAPRAAPSGPISLDGTWNVTIKSPTGPQATVLELKTVNGALTGAQTGQGSTTEISDAKLEGDQITWINHVTKPMKIKVTFTGTVDGNTMSGKAKAGFFGSFPFTAVRG